MSLLSWKTVKESLTGGARRESIGPSVLPGAGGVLSAEFPKGLLQVTGYHPAVPLQGA